MLGTRFLIAALVGTATFGAEVIVDDVRVQSLSPTLLRIEPRGPMGVFESRQTFNVVGREGFGAGGSITLANRSDGGAWLTTPTLDIFIKQEKDDQGGALTAARVWARRADAAPEELWSCERALLQKACSDSDANRLKFPAPSSVYSGTKSYAYVDRPRFRVPSWGGAAAPSGAVIAPELNATSGYDLRNNVADDTYIFLFWRPPTNASATNNSVATDTLAAWRTSRSELVMLTGPCPVLPDWAYGTWFTYWHSYTEKEAMDDVIHWDTNKLPIDVYGLDMNWRNTSNNQDHFYTHPATKLFPDGFESWFKWLHARGLKTYFNDHPYPVADQCAPAEVAFRWQGLSSWMERGLDFWWFDRNWKFSIPPPRAKWPQPPFQGGDWDGLGNAAWGSYLYHTSVSTFYQRHPERNATMTWARALTLTKMATNENSIIPDPGPASSHYEVAAQHRFPVWWTGDNVNLAQAVATMVEQGVSALKPFVHSDCGGDYRAKNGGDLVRWVSMCAMGTILRLHGADHRPWTYNDGNSTLDGVRQWLLVRYRLAPSLIAAGRAATLAGFPLAARADLWWPEHGTHAADNSQYVHLNDTLVAPLGSETRVGAHQNLSTRTVWVPPGEWIDAWNGSVVSGPTLRTVTQPFERLPMWHRAGALVILADENHIARRLRPTMRVQHQDWSTLTLEAFPHSTPVVLNGRKPGTLAEFVTRRMVYERGEGADDLAPTELSLHTAAGGKSVRVEIGAGPRGLQRTWVVRMHLRPGQQAVSAMLDGKSLGDTNELQAMMLPPLDEADGWSHFPFRGAGSRPAPGAGPVLELRAPQAAHARVLKVMLT